MCDQQTLVRVSFTLYRHEYRMPDIPKPSFVPVGRGHNVPRYFFGVGVSPIHKKAMRYSFAPMCVQACHPGHVTSRIRVALACILVSKDRNAGLFIHSALCHCFVPARAVAFGLKATPTCNYYFHFKRRLS